MCIQGVKGLTQSPSSDISRPTLGCEPAIFWSKTHYPHNYLTESQAPYPGSLTADVTLHGVYPEAAVMIREAGRLVISH